MSWLICPACRGNGTHVNPAIDANGLTSEDFANDPDFHDDYMSGVYDQHCEACNGSGKITDTQAADMAQAAEDRKIAALEDGNYEDYLVAHDPRW